MTKVALIGDTHSDSSFVSAVHKQARTDEVEVIVQLGDFGFSFDANMIASIDAWLQRDDSYRWYWVDGNHDQHDYLDALIAHSGTDPSTPISMAALPFEDMYGRSRSGFTHFHERLFYVPRGTVFAIGDTIVQGLGGAYSIDEHYRRAGYSWWPQEMITETEMDYAVKQAKASKVPVDVMLTHEGPASKYLESWLDRFGYKVDPKSAINRNRLTQVVEQVRPKHLYHGHYHERYDTVYTTHDGWDVQVHGIAANIPDSRCRSGNNYVTVEW